MRPALLISTLLGLLGCSKSEPPGDPAAQSSATQARGPSCVVATWTGGELTVANVDTIRMTRMPPLVGAEAQRYAADVALIGRNESSTEMKLKRYTAWQQDRFAIPAEKRVRDRNDLRAELSFKWGPCADETFR